MAAGCLGGCATNPVTGKSELRLIGESWELDVGKNYYEPTIQEGGGAFELDPGLSDYVASVGRRLAAVSDRAYLPYQFTVLNSSIPNAWALPGGKIAINRGLLLQLDSEAELAAVLGHEVVHAAARHTADQYQNLLIAQVAIAGLQVIVANTKLRDYGGLVGLGAWLGTALVLTRYGRDHELEADKYGIQYMAAAGYDTRAAVSLQEKFVKLQSAKSRSWLDGLFASHPPSEERVEKNRETSRAFGTHGRVGAEEYMRETAYLRRTKRAYEAIDAAKQKIKERRYAEAVTLARTAITIEPREAEAFAVRGRAHVLQRRLDDALDDYDRAIRLNDRYFRLYLERGQLRESLRRFSGARDDLETSAALLPTADAHLSLGRIARAEGDTASAIDQFATALRVGGAIDATTRETAAKILLGLAPDRILDVETKIDKSQRLVVVVTNRSPIAVRGVVVELEGGPSPGRRTTVAVNRTIDGGQTVSQRTALGPFSGEVKDLGFVMRLIRANAAE